MCSDDTNPFREQRSSYLLLAKTNHMHTRREFLQWSSLAAAALLTRSMSSCTGAAPSSIGLQLYTLRDELPKDVKGTIAKIAQIGYDNVETFYGYSGPSDPKQFWGLSPADFKKLLSDHNLRSYSGHYQLNDYLTPGNGNADALHAQLALAKELGQDYLVVPVPPFTLIDKLTSADYQFMAAQLNKAGEICKKEGVRLGYHNHFWEFKTQPDGKKGYDILLTETQPDLVCFELDLFWIKKAGYEPLDYFNKFPGRFPMWHVKDMDKASSAPIPPAVLNQSPAMEAAQSVKFAEVGSGSIDFKSIFAAASKAGLKHAFVEQDGIYMADKFASIRQSYTYIKANLLKK